MQSLVAGIHEFLERANQLALSSCGSCYGPGRDRQPLDSVLVSLFDVSPLGDADPEAIRGTQRGARFLHEGRIEEAIREFHSVCNRVPRNAVARTNLGSAYFERGDEDAALHWFRDAYRLDNRSCRILRGVAVLEQRCGNYTEALWLLRNYLQEVDEFNMQVLHQLAMLYRDRQQWTQAGTCFRRLLKADPTNREIAKELQVCLDRSAASGGDVIEYRSHGYNDERSAEIIFGGQSHTLCDERLPPSRRRGDGEEVRPWEMRRGTSADRRSGSVDRRLPSAERRMSIADRRAGSAERISDGGALKQADDERANGNLQHAYTMYRKILDSDGSNTEALRGVVLCLLDTGHGRTAIEAAKRLHALKQSDAEANLLLAEAMLAGGQAPPPECLKAVPSNPRLRSRLMMAQAKVALVEEDFKKALNLALEAVRMETNEGGDIKAMLVLAEVRIQFADYEAALRALSSAEQALRKEQRAVARPLLAQAHSLAAKAQERLRRFPEALEEARRALELDPSQSTARLARAMAMQQTGLAKDAEVELRDLHRRNPQDSEVCVLLGYLQLCLGNSSATTTLQDAVAQTSSRALRKSLAGMAKIYLALALDSQELGDSQVRAEQLVREGLGLHRNLQHVWRAQEKLLPQQQPPYTAAAQQLRGICDLDLTTLQARRLLALLARCSGRHELVRPLASTGACGARAGSMPPPNRQWVPSRAGSQAPTPSDRRSLSPMGYQGHQNGIQPRARSREPPPWNGGATNGLGATYGYGGVPTAGQGFVAFGQPMPVPARMA